MPEMQMNRNYELRATSERLEAVTSRGAEAMFRHCVLETGQSSSWKYLKEFTQADFHIQNHPNNAKEAYWFRLIGILKRHWTLSVAQPKSTTD